MAELGAVRGDGDDREGRRARRRRGFVYPSSDIYGGLGSSFDYGHYGVLLKQNVKAEWQRVDGAGARGHRAARLGDHPATRRCGSPPATSAASPIRSSTAAPASCGSGPTTSTRPSCGRRPSKHPGETPDCDLTEARAVQPDVRDLDRARPRRGLARLPAAGDGAGHLRQLQERHLVAAREAAVRHRADRQELPQRDHARELPLPDARVRADGDGVLRAARPTRSSGTSTGSASAAAGTSTSACARATCACARTTPTSSRTTRAARATSSTSSRSAGRSSRASRTAATTTSPRTPSTRARSSSGSATRSATCRT